MGNFDIKNDPVLGEIIITETAKGLSASLPYQVDENVRLSIIIQNKTGRSVFEETFELDGENTSLLFDLPDLHEGEYDAWIDLKGQVVIRKVTIGPRPATGLFGWFKKKVR